MSDGEIPPLPADLAQLLKDAGRPRVPPAFWGAVLGRIKATVAAAPLAAGAASALGKWGVLSSVACAVGAGALGAWAGAPGGAGPRFGGRARRGEAGGGGVPRAVSEQPALAGSRRCARASERLTRNEPPPPEGGEEQHDDRADHREQEPGRVQLEPVL